MFLFRPLAALFAAWVLMVSVAAPVALAEEAAPAEEMSLRDKADAKFAEWVVGPLASVMFFDIWPFDNRITGKAAVGYTLDGDRVITDWDPSKQYKVQAQWAAAPSRLLPAGESPREVEVGPARISVSLSTAGEPHLEGRVLPIPVQGKDPTQVPENFPIPLEYDPETNTFKEASGKVDMVLPVQVGERVYDPFEKEYANVRELEGGVATLRGEDVAYVANAPLNPNNLEIPFVVAWLVSGAIFFTLRMQFVNLRMFGHAIKVTMGKYPEKHSDGEISHFQALSSALSATVGLGNIAGVAIAIRAGGPGAIFWLIVAAFLGMSSKFVECTLGQMYRKQRSDGSVLGGPFLYLSEGLAEMKLGGLGRVLAVIFAFMCIGGSLGGGNMFQSNQSFAAVAAVFPSAVGYELGYGIVLAGAVAVVIIGGIKRIGAAAGAIVPAMCAIYVLAGLYILIANAGAVPAAFGEIVSQAFTPDAAYGGMIGVLITGFQRASFSNEAGVGSASIAHAAATTGYPVREGIVALLEPFIDTIIVCSMTGLVVVVTGVYADPSMSGMDGVGLTSVAFGSVLSWFPIILAMAVLLFAFSTMISWSFYGESATVWLFGEKAILPYRVVFVLAVVAGAVLNLGSVIDFSDLMILGMAFPNILGGIILSGKVRAALQDYVKKLKGGAFDAAT